MAATQNEVFDDIDDLEDFFAVHIAQLPENIQALIMPIFGDLMEGWDKYAEHVANDDLWTDRGTSATEAGTVISQRYIAGSSPCNWGFSFTLPFDCGLVLHVGHDADHVKQYAPKADEFQKLASAGEYQTEFGPLPVVSVQLRMGGPSLARREILNICLIRRKTDGFTVIQRFLDDSSDPLFKSKYTRVKILHTYADWTNNGDGTCSCVNSAQTVIGGWLPQGLVDTLLPTTTTQQMSGMEKYVPTITG